MHIYVPNLLHQPKWFISDKDLLSGDLVYLNKEEGKLGNMWIVRMVQQSKNGKDGVLKSRASS